MINKSDYHKLKKYLKFKSQPEINELLDCVCLNDDERKLFLSWYNGDTRVKSSIDNYICCDTYTNYLKKIFSKIYNYYEYNNMLF